MELETAAPIVTARLPKSSTWVVDSWEKQQRNDPVRNLDLLRACAVMLVVLCHFFSNGLNFYDRGYTFPHSMGRLGVMMFFVHTSLVLMMSLERTGLRKANSLRSFYLRRAFRIYPLSILTVLAVVWLHIPTAPFELFEHPSHFQLLSNLTLTQNIAHARPVIGPLWSLPWEIQMYLVLPFLFLLVRNKKLTWLCAIAAGILATNVIGLSLGNKLVRILDYAPCFLSGVMAYVLVRSRKLPQMSGRLWPLVLTAVMGGYIWLGIGWPQRKVFYREWAVCIVLGLLIPLFNDMTAAFTSTVAHVIAKYSYGIYLFHVPALWLAFDRLGWLGNFVSTLVFVGATATMSVIGYHLIEAPMINCGKWLLKNRGIS